VPKLWTDESKRVWFDESLVIQSQVGTCPILNYEAEGVFASFISQGGSAAYFGAWLSACYNLEQGQAVRVGKDKRVRKIGSIEQ
jgi:hypothetical protein